MNDNITQFELLLEAGKIEEAKAMLDSMLGRDLSPKDEALSKGLLTRLYIKLTNAINEEYLETLKSAISQLKELESSKKDFNQSVKLAETRAELAK